jgi:hypothetical protein
LKESGKQSGDYVYSNRGASERIIQFLQERKYLV